MTELAPADLVAGIKPHMDRLNEWERNFVRDIESKIKVNWNLSDKQIAKLKAIHEDHVE